MMTVTADQLHSLNNAYEQVFDVFDANNLKPEDAFGLLVRLTVQIAGDIPKQEMLAIIAAAYDLDRFLRPQPKEVH
jgi:hypothetical protein